VLCSVTADRRDNAAGCAAATPTASTRGTTPTALEARRGATASVGDRRPSAQRSGSGSESLALSWGRTRGRERTTSSSAPRAGSRAVPSTPARASAHREHGPSNGDRPLDPVRPGGSQAPHLVSSGRGPRPRFGDGTPP